MDRIEILLGADLVPTESNKSFFINGNIEKIIDPQILSLLKSVDLRIFNLEVPLCEIITPIKKCGLNLFSHKTTIKGIKKLNPSLLTLANNHILDQGGEGLKSTEKILIENDIPFVGAGDNLSEASKPYIITYKNKKIGVYACAETEFTIAKKNSPGANPFDPLESLDHIEKLRKETEYLIVLYHGGKEYYRYPSPYLQKVTRKFIDKGADLVVCQHSHCIGCEEKYKGSTIIYGQGNFLFDESEDECWQTSLLIKISIGNDSVIDYIPIIKNNNGIKLPDFNNSKEIMQDFKKRSTDILKKDFIENNYQNFSQDYLKRYLKTLAGYGKWKSRLDRYIFKDNLIKYKYNKKTLLAIQNYIECEAHRELLLTSLKGENNGKVR